MRGYQLKLELAHEHVAALDLKASHILAENSGATGCEPAASVFGPPDTPAKYEQP